MAAYMRCLRCAGAPRRPAGGSELSPSILSRHADLYDPGEFDHRKSRASMTTWPSPRSERLGTPNPPAIRFARGSYFGASRFTHLLRPASLLAPLYGSDRYARPPGAFTSRLSTARSPSPLLDYNSDWTPLLAGLSPARMAASLAAPDPYERVSHIRLLTRVSDGIGFPYTSERLGHTFPAQSPVCALLVRVPLGPRPWLHRLRSGRTRLVRRLPSYYGGVRLLTVVHHRLRLLAFPMRASAAPTMRRRWSTVRSPGSRATSMRACRVLRPRRVVQALALALLDVLPSATQTASAPGISFLSRLDGWPARSPADASPTSSRMPAHGSGPMRFAIPSS